MKNDFDYSLVSYGFPHCFNDQCRQADSCLRHLAAKQSKSGSQYINVLNPAYYPSDGKKCPAFLTSTKVKIAWGITHLLDDVPHRIASQMRRMMISHFTKSLYYRYYRKERGVSPEDQLYIRTLFKQNGIQMEPVFDYYTEEYIW